MDIIKKAIPKKARIDGPHPAKRTFQAIRIEVNNEIDGVLADLGVSSHQLDEADRGFSYMQDAPLDMRMDVRKDFSAYNVVNEYTEEELAKIIKDYGEDNWAKRIAKFIVEGRAEKPIETTGELVDIIKKAIPKKARIDGPHPAKRTFQAIRIEVNNELGVITKMIDDACSIMNPGGRICIITFHSLDIIKKAIPKKARIDGPHPAKRTFQAIRIEVNNELGVITKMIDDACSIMNPGGRICIITFHSLKCRRNKNESKIEKC